MDIEAIREHYAVPALAGALVEPDSVEVHVAGFRKQGASAAVDASDKWHLGSETKAMTAMLVGVYITQGRLRPHTSIAQVFPEWRKSMERSLRGVTLEDLLAHRSGIAVENKALAQFTEEGDILAQRERAAFDLLHRRICHRRRWHYENANYILVGAMLERAIGTPWEVQIQRELFQPLGMTTAGFGSPAGPDSVEQPWGHAEVNGVVQPILVDNPPLYGPAGTVHASMDDWAKFVQLHLKGDDCLQMRRRTLTILHSGKRVGVFAGRYGWGWRLVRVNRHYHVIQHDGSNGSWYASATVHLQRRVAFLAATNIGGQEHGSGDKACHAMIRSLVHCRNTLMG